MGFRSFSHPTLRRNVWTLWLWLGFLPAVSSATDFEGRVEDDESGEAVPGVDVRLPELDRTSVTDAFGIFHFHDVEPGRYRLDMLRIGYRNEHLTVEMEGAESKKRFLLHATPLEVPGLIVTGVVDGRLPGEVVRPTEVVSGRRLSRQLSDTVAKTLEGTAGVTIAHFGPATSKPTIRGLSGDRVLMLQDGERVGDVAGSGADHASATEVLSAERIEVVRGPAALIHGGNALGGVVNVVTRDIPHLRPDHTHASVTVRGETVTPSGALGAHLLHAFGPATLRLEGTARRAGDVQTPVGVLMSSDVQKEGLALGLGFSQDAAHGGGSYRFHHSNYGVPGGMVGGHPDGVRIDVVQHRAGLLLESHDAIGPFCHGKFTATGSSYRQDEFEAGGILGTHFGVDALEGRALLDIEGSGLLADGTVGTGLRWESNTVAGQLDTPASQEVAGTAYGVLGWSLAPFKLDLGLRFDTHQIRPDDHFVSATIGEVRTRTFSALSGAIGGLLNFGQGWSVGASLSRAYRAPSPAELFSEGPHLAAYTFEVGNPELDIEAGFGLDALARIDREHLQMEVALFQNRISGYIYPRATGEISRLQLPIYQYVGEQAQFSGLEGRLAWLLWPDLVLEGTLSYVRAELEGGEPLPWIPPLTGRLALRWETAAYFFEGAVSGAGSQSRVAEFETPTDGYLVPQLVTGLRWFASGVLQQVSLSVENLWNSEYRNHLSRVKEVAPEPGRNVYLVYKMEI